MTRIPFLPADLTEPKDVVESIRARRGGHLLNLDRLLLYSPAFAVGWSAHLRAVRTELSISPKLRELAICLVATLNGADYEFHHHVPLFIAAGGAAAQADALRHAHTIASGTTLFDTVERAVIQLAIEMTRDVRVSDATFALVQAALPNEQQIVELIGIIASYNMVSRFLVALEIEPES